MAASADSKTSYRGYAYEIEPGIPADATFPWLVRIILPKGAAAESYLRFEHPLVQKLAAVITATGGKFISSLSLQWELMTSSSRS